MVRRVFLVLIAAMLLVPATAAARGHYSSHSQLYSCCTPPAEADALFRDAHDSGAAFIRVDVAMDSVFPRPGDRDWAGTDRVAALSARYRLPVLAVLEGTPRRLAGCAATTLERRRLCPPAKPRRWARYAGELAARYAGRIGHFEIWNEPDQPAYRLGTARQYGALLADSYAAIKAAAPGAKVVLGGLSNDGESGRAWLGRALAATRGRPAFDIGAVHVRRPLDQLAATIGAWMAFYRSLGMDVPLWVTEHGYPSDPRAQRFTGFQAGAASQAEYLSRSVPIMVAAGAQQVFVTLRDNPQLGPAYASEGVVGESGAPRKPAFERLDDASVRWPWPLGAGRLGG